MTPGPGCRRSATGVSTYYLAINRNKRSVALDLKDEHDAGLARELASRADIVLENFRPGGLARFGLDYDSVAAVNPGVVYASITGFGTGGGAALPGYDLIVQAIAGLMSLTGAAGRAAVPGRDLGVRRDVRAARDDRGAGRATTRDSRPAAASTSRSTCCPPRCPGWSTTPARSSPPASTPTRMGNSHPSLFPYDPLPTADGELIITAGNDRQFRKLCEVLGVPELADDPRFARNKDRTANRDELRPLLEERLRTRTKDEWFRDIIAAGVPCGPINTVNDGVAFATELGLDPVVEPGGVPSIRNPITFSETPARYELPPPGLDEHGAEIRAWLEEKA